MIKRFRSKEKSEELITRYTLNGIDYLIYRFNRGTSSYVLEYTYDNLTGRFLKKQQIA